jgi:Ca-activated chloride channel family protein
MTGLPLAMAKAGAAAVVKKLRDGDCLEVIAFDSQPARAAGPRPGRDRAILGRGVDAIQPGGGTEIFAALAMAYQDLTMLRARKKYIVLLTDGMSPSHGIRELASAAASESITISTIGLGTNTDEELLKMISDVGAGRFHRVLDAKDLPALLTREIQQVQGGAKGR